ncbi:MAG: restriction endonuclease [Phycisphaeraceae bacterium]|nr:MAG: restriction endonuclease [Phycisphaeraceae bacterium]
MPSNEKLDASVRKAVRHFWKTQGSQGDANRAGARADHGRRSSVTGGKHMDGFFDLFRSLVRAAGVSDADIFTNSGRELPGYFRPTKQWDVLVVVKGRLLAVIETKSMASSFSNNFNNRVEEAIGSAVDLRTAYREGAYGASADPWLGYLMLIVDSEASRTRGLQHKEPHFRVFTEFSGAPYLGRAELLCRRLVRERHYNGAACLWAPDSKRARGEYHEPAEDLTFRGLAASLVAHCAAFKSMTTDRPDR